MALNATVFINNGDIKLRAKLEFHYSDVGKFEYGRTQKTDLASRRTRSRAIRVLANPNASRGEERTKKVVIMVDPLEAKRLAAKQMEEIKAKERFQRRRQIEAINGAWAMIGLTVGLVIEGHTGLSIPSQLASYVAAVIGFFTG
ncbi:putative RING-H2 finger protein ATL56-like [Capsicum annuum]|uniref:uncharacterized protein LOC107877530 n=1 Tax=Capsicum annuum TaxID=4072 RepID=UPI0007BFBEA0|nr:uncharacterized protein LOC107877530 [Capsicum annuum]XP_016579682.1 uncharacterized protein LOC107877530 [Capsicum annuum]KAF3619998.1 putative RING-H2 finger protein ATL56-like [Capsicum annuum]